MSIHPTHLSVHPVRAFSDNYIWLIDSPQARGRLVAVDPGDAAPVIAELQRSGASLAAILLTHHHPDHIGGVPDLLRRWEVPVIGPDDDRIAQRTRTVRDGECCDLPDLGLSFEILQVPGHTLSHIAVWGHGRRLGRRTRFRNFAALSETPLELEITFRRRRIASPPSARFC